MLLQYIVNGLFYGTTLALPAIGLTLIFAVLRFPTFALAVHLAVGAYAGYVLNTGFGWPLVPAYVASFVVAGCVGVLTDEAAVKPLDDRGSLAIAIVTIAIGVIIENVLRFAFGNSLRGFDVPLYRDSSFVGLRFGIQPLINFGVALVIMVIVFLFLNFTRLGKAMRAVADNRALAALRGIDPDWIRRIAVFIGMGLAGLGGMLIAVETSVDPLLGTRTMLPIFAATILGGLGSVPGALVGALLIGVISETSLMLIPPTYRSAISFIVLIVVLTLRPQGLLGDRQR
jgi:branched-chain amino acid transport system permease protein/neutral amino acid transport system permease protein